MSKQLQVKDDGERNIIPQSIGLIAGRTGQEYNRRKCRKGAFWEDRYHSAAMEAMAKGRTIRDSIEDGFELREAQSGYNAVLDTEYCDIASKKA